MSIQSSQTFPDSKLHKLHLTTANVNGLKDNGHLLAQKLVSRTEILALQETKFANIHQYQTFCFHLDHNLGVGKYFIATNDHRHQAAAIESHRSAGVAMIFHHTIPGFDALQHEHHLDITDHYMVVSSMWGDVPIFYHNVYSPISNTDRTDFYSALPRNFPPNAKHIVMGDFNFPMDRLVDSVSGQSNHHTAREECFTWLQELNVLDAWRMHHPTTRVYSSPKRNNRLDYIFVDEPLCQTSYHSSEYFEPSDPTDHLWHRVVLQTVAHSPCKGYWKLPKELLADADIRDAIIHEATALLNTIRTSVEPGIVWQTWKRKTKRFLQKMHTRQQVMKNNSLQTTHIQWLQAQWKHNHGQLPLDDFHTAKTAFETAKEEWAQRCKDTSFDFHANNNEKSTSHFFRPPTARSYNVPITACYTSTGQATTDKDTIHEAFIQHWSRIMGENDFITPNQAVRDAFLNVVNKQLSSTDRVSLDAPLSPAELAQAISTMAPHKAPGIDGLPACFFQLAPTIFGEILCIVFNWQLQQGSLDAIQRHSAITLLFKGGDRLNPANYRPIALIPIEVKILSRTLAYRLSPLLPDIIQPEQSGFVPGRRIHDHIIFLQDLQHHFSQQDCSQHICAHENCTGYAMFLDFEKAYDRVNHAYLFDVLKKFNIGDNFINWVRLLYTDTLVSLNINGELTSPFAPLRGVKQGDPLSSMLFVLAVEPLAQLLRNNDAYGLMYSEHKNATVLMFADDTTLLASSVQDLEYQLELVDEYCRVSGAKLNRSKSKVLTLNAHQDVLTHPRLNFVVSGEPIKYLGIYFGHRLDRSYQLNIISDKFYQSFLTWGCRARTLQGRRLLVNSMILSQLWHFTMVIPVPRDTIRKWQSMVNKFIMNRRTRPQDKYVALTNSALLHEPVVGLKIPHIASLILRQRVNRLRLLISTAQDPDQQWTILPQAQFRDSLTDYGRPSHWDFLLYRPQLRNSLVQWAKISPLWLDIWQSWTTLPYSKVTPAEPPIETYLRMPLWLTSHPLFQVPLTREISCLGSTLRNHRPWYRHLASNGLHCLEDFLTPDRAWPTLEQFSMQLHPYRFTFNGPDQPPSHFGYLYTLLSHIARNVWTQCNLAWDEAAPNRDFEYTVFSTMVKREEVPLAQWTKAIVAQVCSAKTPLTKAHPLETQNRTTYDAVSSYCRHHVRRFMHYPTPVQADVWYRILFKLLPVNAKFSSMTLIRPTAAQCSYPGCYAQETQQHVLMDCPKVSRIWHFHRQAWANLGIQFRWNWIIDLTQFRVATPWLHHRNVLHRLWFLLITGLLHILWQHRNKVKFEGHSHPHVPAFNEVSLLHWSSNVRRWKRRCTDPNELQAIDFALHHLGQSRTYRWFWSKYPNAFRS